MFYAHRPFTTLAALPPEIEKFKMKFLFISQTNMEGGQSGTYLRLTRVSSGLRVSIAKTYRDETKRK